jgi:hypothetical protein
MAKEFPMSRPRTNWAAARQGYVTSDQTLGEIAAQYGCSEQAIKRRSMLDRWTDARNAFRRAVNQKADAAQAESRAHKLKEWNDNDLKFARAIRGQAAKVLATVEDGDISTLRNLASIVESTQRIGRLALGATTDNQGVIGDPGEDGAGIPHLKDFYKSVVFEGPTESAATPEKQSEDDPPVRH